jgi:hypothetical protein
MSRFVLRLIPVPVLLLAAIPTQSRAQEHAAEIQALEALVGSWTYDHLEGGAECTKLGDLMIHCRSVWATSGGNEMDLVSIVRYDTATEMFRGYRFYNSGYADEAVGWIDGNDWVFVYDAPSGNKVRFTATLSDTSWVYQWHRSVQGGPWEARSDGSMTKVR